MRILGGYRPESPRQGWDRPRECARQELSGFLTVSSTGLPMPRCVKLGVQSAGNPVTPEAFGNPDRATLGDPRQGLFFSGDPFGAISLRPVIFATPGKPSNSPATRSLEVSRWGQNCLAKIPLRVEIVERSSECPEGSPAAAFFDQPSSVNIMVVRLIRMVSRIEVTHVWPGQFVERQRIAMGPGLSHPVFSAVAKPSASRRSLGEGFDHGDSKWGPPPRLNIGKSSLRDSTR